jgi:F-type H+-transporting ATPase subunit b
MGALITTFGVDWRSLGLEVVNFAILVAVLTWLLYKPVLKMVKERQQIIAKGVEDAEAAATQLRATDAEVKTRISVAETEAAGIVENARGAANDTKARILKDADERAAQVAADAEARAKEAQAKALRESEKEIARLAVLAAAKIMSEKA